MILVMHNCRELSAYFNFFNVTMLTIPLIKLKNLLMKLTFISKII